MGLIRRAQGMPNEASDFGGNGPLPAVPARRTPR